MPPPIQRAVVIACCLYCGLLVPSRAEEVAARSYAVLSLLGDTISIVTQGAETGHRIDQNQKDTVAIPNAVFDEAALLAADRAIRLSQPEASTVLMVTRDHGLYQAQNGLFDAIESNRENREFLKKLLKDRPVSHLILITKFRAEAELRTLDTALGTGRLEGLGFFMDDNLAVRDEKTLASGTGILAPFAYVKVRLLDARTLQVIREAHEKKSRVAGNFDTYTSGKHAWQVLTAKQKIAYLQDLIGVAMTAAIPGLLPHP